MKTLRLSFLILAACVQTLAALYPSTGGAASTNMVAATIGTLTSTNFAAEQVTAQSFTVVGMPLDIRAAGAVVDIPVTNNTNPALVSTYKGSGRTALETAIAAGYTNVSLAAGKWNFYQGVDAVTYKDQGITVSRDLVLQGVPGQTILDFGREGGANSDAQVEFIHTGGTIEFRDLDLRNYSYLIAPKFSTRNVTNHAKIRFVNCKFSGGAPISPMWSPYGPPALTWDGAAWTWANGVSDVYRTNVLSGRTWTTDTGWTDEGDGTWSYAQPAAFGSVTNVSRASTGLVTAIMEEAHGLNAGDWITIDVASNTFDESTLTRVHSTPAANTFTYYQASTTVLAATTTGTIRRMGALKLTHPFVFRGGDLQRYRMGLVSKTAGSGPRLYVGGTLSQPINRAKSHAMSGIQRNGGGTPRYTRITVTGSHSFKPGDIVDVKGTTNETLNSTVFTVVNIDSSSRLECTPDIGASGPIDTTSAGMTVNYYEFPLDGGLGRALSSGNYITTFTNTVLTGTNTTPHLLTQQLLVTFNFGATASASFGGGLHRILTTATTTNFTFADYRPGLTSNYDSSVTGLVTQVFGEVSLYPLGFDNKVELVASPDFAGRIDVGELWTANFTDVEAHNCTFDAPAAFTQNGRAGITTPWAWRTMKFVDCTFTGGDQWLYLGKSDSDTVYWEAHAYAPRPTLTRCEFRGIGLTPGYDARGAYIFGRDVSISDCIFEGVGYGTGISKNSSRQALYFAADGAVVTRTRFSRSGDTRMVLIKGDYDTIDQSNGIAGAPVGRFVTFRECVFDGEGGANTQPIEVDGAYTKVIVDNCEIRDFPSALYAISAGSQTDYGDYRILNSSIRNCPLMSVPLRSTTAQMSRLTFSGNEVQLQSLSRLVIANSPFSVDVCDNLIMEPWGSARGLGFGELVHIATVVSGYGVNYVKVSGNRYSGTVNLVSGLVNLPSGGGLTVTNMILLDNSVGTTSTLIANEGVNTINKLVARGNYPVLTTVERTTGLWVRTNSVEQIVAPTP